MEVLVIWLAWLFFFAERLSKFVGCVTCLYCFVYVWLLFFIRRMICCCFHVSAALKSFAQNRSNPHLVTRHTLTLTLTLEKIYQKYTYIYMRIVCMHSSIFYTHRRTHLNIYIKTMQKSKCAYSSIQLHTFNVFIHI